jgi:hypothetical protein
MTDAADPQTPPLSAAEQTVASEAPPAWKPEPRQWSWKDLFTAPMLAFKPKCMLISAVTLILVGLWVLAFTEPIGGSRSLYGQLKYSFDTPVWLDVVGWLWTAVGVVIFSLGATFVSVFLKADLLDDEFLSFKEAWVQYTPRVLPAILVPLFLLVLVTGVWGAIWLGSLVCSIPYAGSTLYALLWPLAFGAAILGVLIAIAVILSAFLFPGIIAVRRHGWFDNVVDTIEAVGTKPHLLVGSLILTYVLLLVSYNIGMKAVDSLSGIARSLPAFATGNQVQQVDQIAASRRTAWLRPFEPVVYPVLDPDRRNAAASFEFISQRDEAATYGGFITWGPGLIAACWQTLIVAFLVGYCLNLALAGGMLTYLWVREDDYWDDEDLQDLDQLAKELEDEAKREELRGKTQATVADA